MRDYDAEKKEVRSPFVSTVCCVGRRQNAECCCCCSRSSALYASMALSEVQNQTSCEKCEEKTARGGNERRERLKMNILYKTIASATAATAVKTQQRRCSRDTPAADDDEKYIKKKQRKKEKFHFLMSISCLHLSSADWVLSSFIKYLCMKLYETRLMISWSLARARIIVFSTDEQRAACLVEKLSSIADMRF